MTDLPTIPYVPYPPPWVKQAAEILRHAAEGDHQKAANMINGLALAHGRHIGPYLLIVWIDMLQTSIGVRAGDIGLITMEDADTGEVRDVDHVDWPNRWAARAINARIARDAKTFAALCNSVPDKAAWNRAVWATMLACALTIRDGRRVEYVDPDKLGPPLGPLDDGDDLP